MNRIFRLWYCCGVSRNYTRRWLRHHRSTTFPSHHNVAVSNTNYQCHHNMWVSTFCGLYFILNCFPPLVLIVHRIWTILSAVRQLVPSIKNHPLKNTLVVLIESASVYTASAAVMLTVYVLRSNADYVVSDLVRFLFHLMPWSNIASR